MKAFSSLSFRLLGTFISADQETRRETTRALRAARMSIFPEWYLAQSYFAAIIGSLVATLAAIGAIWWIQPQTPSRLTLGLLVLGVAVVSFSVIRLVFLLYPRLRSSTRSQEIDAEYQSVVVMCYALARGGMGTLEIFRLVAKEESVYGEISREFASVVRDVDLFGVDMITAMQNASAVTPSSNFKGFLEGLVTILNSGADPRDYFRRQAEVQIQRAEIEMEAELGRAGMLAEVYVSSFLVLPLLLLVVLSGLSSLGNGDEQWIPMVVYTLIPAGTLIYAMALHVSMPSPDLKAPIPRPEELSDFGIGSLPANAERLPPPWKIKHNSLDAASTLEERPPFMVRARSLLHRTREHIAASWKRKKEQLVLKPIDAIEYSGIAALLVVGIGAYYVMMGGYGRMDQILLGTEFMLVALFVALAPVALFHEIRILRARRVESALPEMLSKLAGFNERGIGLLQSFQLLGRSTTGPLSAELRMVERDVNANGNLQGAIRRMRDRVKTLRMTKLAVLLERASMSTSNMKEILDIAAADETRTEGLRSRKRGTMMSYVIVIYLVFAVFLYVTYMVTSLFYGDASFAVAVGPSATSAATIGQGLAADDAKIYFLHAVVLQGLACGLVAGRLGEGHILSGVKHALIMSVGAWAVFAVGVL